MPKPVTFTAEFYGFAAAKQSATRIARIKKAMPAIVEAKGFLERAQGCGRS